MTSDNHNTDDEFAGIPDMPSDDSLRDEILQSGDIARWNPFGQGDRDPVDFRKMPEDTAESVLKSRMVAGPGPGANAFQQAIHEQYQRTVELENEFKRIERQLDEVRGYDPATGKGIPMIGDPQKRKAMGWRLATITEDLARIEGEPGKQQLENALAKAVHQRKLQHKNAYIQAEAKRRAAAEATEAEIERHKAGFAKAARSGK